MTARACYHIALSILSETPQTAGEYDQFALMHLGHLLASVQPQLEAMAELAGQNFPAEGVHLSSLDAPLPVPERMAKECLPYGLAALLVCEDDKLQFNRCANEFATRLTFYNPALYTDLEAM